MVSPRALMIPRRQAWRIPGSAEGTATRKMVSLLVAPRAKEASRRAWGTAARLSSAMEATMGIVRIPNSRAALNRLSPERSSNRL